MKIPMRVDYGVRALVELAIHYGEGPIPTADIAAKQGIPVSYLDQLMASLNKFGFVSSRRGPKGGHTLAIHPDEVNLSVVMSKLDPHSPPIDCLVNPLGCVLSESCAQQEVWKSVEEAITDVLRNITLSDLARRQLSLTPIVQSPERSTQVLPQTPSPSDIARQAVL